VTPTLAPLTLPAALAAWRTTPGVLAAPAGLGGGYRWGLRRRRAHHDDRWPVGRAVVFFAGVATIVLVGCSFLGVYDDAYFWVRAVQNTVLLMVTPMLLALGAPIRLAADTLPPWVRGPLARALHSRPARVLRFPLLVTLALVVPLLVLYLSPLYARSPCGARSRPGWRAPSWRSSGSSTTGRGSGWTPRRAPTRTSSRSGSRSSR
jgi:cytochrome c oxidase assembly factor CtaG